jgi:hypothetical protein
MRRNIQTYSEEAGATDDGAVVWMCPDRCKSMPFFQIKVVFDYWKRTEQYQHWYIFEGYKWVWKGQWFQEVYWKYNSDYRAGFSPADLTTLPSSESEGLPFPSSQVKTVGTCKSEAIQGNKLDHDDKCWPSDMTHLSSLFPKIEFSGLSEVSKWEPTPVQIENCPFISDSINPYVKPCLQAQQNGIFIKPAYKFFAGAQSQPYERTCAVVRYQSLAVDASEVSAQRQTKIQSFWRTPPTYKKHQYNFKNLRDEKWGADNKDIRGWKDEHLDLAEGTAETGAANSRRYEWFCYDLANRARTDFGNSGSEDSMDNYRKYYNAILYESKCESANCEDFVSRACWENSYSIAASTCHWVKTFKTATDLTTVAGGEFAKSMNVYGNGKYIITIPSSMNFRIGGIEQSTSITMSTTDAFTIELKDMFSCSQCEDAVRVRGMVLADQTKGAGEVAECKECAAYERLDYHRCLECDTHKIRNSNKWIDCVSCAQNTPMRRAGGVDQDCKTCQILDYFNGADADGCLRLKSVMDGRTATEIKGVDEYYSGGMPREIMPKHYRVVQVQTVWNAAVTQDACDYTANAVGYATELSYRRWCGHREIVREQQALLKYENTSYLYANESTTTGVAAIGDLCQQGSLKATTAGLFDLTCRDGRNKEVSVSVVRSGHPEKCTLCRGATYTKRCWPTYHADLASEEVEYFEGSGRFKRMSSNGTCAVCAGQCAGENHYMQPTRFSCMWNGTANGRMLGTVSALPSTGFYYWYKQSPCIPCADVDMNTTHAMLHKQCGNKRTYRIWDPLQTVPKEVRSIPLVRTCCSMKLAGKAECTESEFSSWINENCQVALSLLDVAPVKETYCPPGWYVDKACAESTPAAWAPDCCKRCGGCTGSMFKTESYATCTGATFIDTERNGCNRDCLSNSYMKGGNCYRCESCSTTGTGEHGLESV